MAIKAEALAHRPWPVYPHTTCLSHGTRRWANAPGRHAKRAQCDFAGAGACPAQRGKPDRWIQQSLSQGHTLGRALALASQLAWGGRHYSPRTLEGWLYEYRAAGFAALHRQSRRDKGQIRALLPEGVQAILKLRLSQPTLPVTALVRQLLVQGVLEPGTFSNRLSSSDARR
jgi:hypothetical protein